MKLRKFRLIGFRCVEDSGIVHMATDLTIFAGKNESGKSAILDGISFFMTDQGFLPFGDKTQGFNDSSRLWTEFELDKDDISYLTELLNVSIQTPIVSIEYKEEDVTVSGPALKDMVDQLNKRIEEINGSFSKVLENILPQETKGAEAEANDLEAKKLEVNEDKPFKDDEEKGFIDKELAIHDIMSDDEYISEHLRQLLKRVKSLPENTLEHPELRNLLQQRSRLKELLDSLQDIILERIPPVIHFRSFEDELPDFISLDKNEELPNIVRDFCTLSGLNIKQLKESKSPQERKYIQQANELANVEENMTRGRN